MTSALSVTDPAAASVTQVAYDAGFRGKALVDAVSIALSESGGNPAAINNNPATGDYSVGYWQINYFGALGPARTQQFGPASSLAGVNPVGPEAQANAKAAYALSGGGKTWSPWQADFTNGNYYKNYPRAQAAVIDFTNNNGGLSLTDTSGSDSIQTLSQVDSGSGDHCLIHLGASVPILNAIPGVNSLGPCLLSTSNVRAIGGALLIAGGILVGGLGVALLVGRSVDLGGVVGKVSPSGWVGAVTAKSTSNDRKIDTIERNAYEQGRREGASKGTMRDRKFTGKRFSNGEPNNDDEPF